MQRLSVAVADRYVIERELGQGGMATVYLAADLKHDRKVALKVLRPELAAVLGADRFIVEIKTTAALQHPHILPLFDSGSADGFLYYVMPFIDGETLRSTLDRETQLGIDQAVRIASNVADALDYAHRHGVIHRDIKPENILLHDGRPMVADFGIALALSAAAGGRMTETGMSLGTPHYMSPEQATAEKEITARSDVYSLGSVLYEMLAGEPPHTGGSAQQIIMKIIAEDAQDVTALRRSVPAHVAAAVAKSLEKLPADRFESAAAFAAALVNPAFTRAPTTGRAAAGGGSRIPWRGLALLATAASLALVVPAFRSGRTADAPGPPWRVRIVLPDSAPVAESMAMSPDGSLLVWEGGGRLWMRTADATDPVPIPGGEDATSPAVSPDSRRIAFRRGGSLLVQTLGTGAPVTMATGLIIGSAFGWTDDQHVAYAGLYGLMLASTTGGEPRAITHVDSASHEVLHIRSTGLPGGKAVLFTIASRNFDSSVIAVARISDGRVTRLMPGLAAVYAPPGHLIVTRIDGTIVAVPLDVGRLRLTGEPIPIASGLHTGAFTSIGSVAASAAGRLVYVAAGWGMTDPPTDLVWVSATGQVTPADTTWTGNFESVALSPDGRKAVIGMASERTEDLLVRDLASGSVARVTIPGTILRDPAFSPDGHTLYFVGMGARHGVHRADPGGTEAPERAAETTFSWIGQPTVGGGRLYYSTSLGGGRQLMRHALSASGPDSAIETAAAAPGNAQVSPDGRWLAYLALSSSRPAELHVRSTDAARSEDWRVVESVDPGAQVRWSRAGNQLFFVAGGMMRAAPVTTGASFSFGAPRTLFANAGRKPVFDVGADGRFLMIRNRPSLRPRTELVMLERWTDLLPR